MFLLLAALAVQCPARDRYCDEISRIINDARVRRASQYIEQTEPNAVRELIVLAQIPAPPFKESERARRYAELMRLAGADSVALDDIGNVIALRRGTVRGRRVVVAGHLDTVFPEGTDVRVRIRGDTLFGAGIADDSRGLITMLQVMRSLVRANIRTDADLVFVATVGEEGLGDLRGARNLFRPNAPRVDAFIGVDGASDDAITNSAIGSKRYRVTFTGVGGHSWGAFGTANPAAALARALTKFDDDASRFAAFGSPTTYNIGRIGGGTSVNAIPEEAWAEIDMRSESPTRLDAIDSIFHVDMVEALNEQNAHRTAGPELSLEARLVGDRPSGTTAATEPLVQRAIAATRVMGLTPRLDESSADANVPISRGIPAITIGRGGIAGKSHSTEEYWVKTNATRGVRRLLYLVVAEGGLKT